MSKVRSNIRLFSQTILHSAAYLVALFIFTAAASAATYTVDTTVDDGTAAFRACTEAANDCSLRGAVRRANAQDGASDTITFALPQGVNTITLTNGNLATFDVAEVGALTITNSTGASNLRISGNNASRVFFVDGGANLTLNGVTVTMGNDLYGGGILISGPDQATAIGTLTLTNSIVSGNTANSNGGGGGGIANYGTTTLTNSTVSGNTALFSGGIFNQGGTLSLTNSTVSGNTANSNGGGGGGISNSGGTLSLLNSTVSGNSSIFGGTGISGSGGGIANYGTATLTNSTVSGNRAATGGGISSFGTLNLTSVTVAYNTARSGGGIENGDGANLSNTIVAKNIATTGGQPPDFSGVISPTSSFDLIGSGAGMTGIMNGTNGNQVGTTTNPIDPKLDPVLALNGGTTLNHALLVGSPAIDTGFSFGLATDQRGFIRPNDNVFIANAAGGDGSDIGAFEVQFAPTAANVSVSGRITTQSGRGIRNVQITMIDSNGNQRTAQTTAFGYYRFDDVAAGETVTLSVKARQFRFDQPTIVRTTNESIADANFISEQ